MENKVKILICDENNEERTRLIEILERGGFSTCVEANNGEEAINLISKNSVCFR